MLNLIYPRLWYFRFLEVSHSCLLHFTFSNQTRFRLFRRGFFCLTCLSYFSACCLEYLPSNPFTKMDSKKGTACAWPREHGIILDRTVISCARKDTSPKLHLSQASKHNSLQCPWWATAKQRQLGVGSRLRILQPIISITCSFVANTLEQAKPNL